MNRKSKKIASNFKCEIKALLIILILLDKQKYNM